MIRSPLVSVVLCVYNAEIFIDITIESVLKQTYKNMEVLVLNDNSKD
jgi:glycosyltransferase involved in cell wall biosynthesis